MVCVLLAANTPHLLTAQQIIDQALSPSLLHLPRPPSISCMSFHHLPPKSTIRWRVSARGKHLLLINWENIYRTLSNISLSTSSTLPSLETPPCFQPVIPFKLPFLLSSASNSSPTYTASCFSKAALLNLSGNTFNILPTWTYFSGKTIRKMQRWNI